MAASDTSAPTPASQRVGSRRGPYYGSAAHVSDLRLATYLIALTLAAGTCATWWPRLFTWAAAAAVRYTALALILLHLGLTLGCYEIGNWKRLPLTISMASFGRLIGMPVATAALVLPLGIQLDAASVACLLFISASPSGYAPIWVAALTNSSVRELAAMMTFASVSLSLLTVPLLLLVSAAVARFPVSAGVMISLAGDGSGGASAILASALLYMSLVTAPFALGIVMAVLLPARRIERIRQVLRPPTWAAVASLAGGSMAMARMAPPSFGSRGVFIASLLVSLIGVVAGLVAGRAAGHTARVRRTIAYECALPGVAITAALAPAATAGYTCAATVAAQAVTLLAMNIYYAYRKSYASAPEGGGVMAAQTLTPPGE